MKNILFLLGTARQDNMSSKVANFVVETSKKRTDINVNFVKVQDFPQTSTNSLSQELTEKWSQMVTDANGMVIISPEYNHGYPGELKLLLDAAYKEYYKKPVAICAVSNGPIGGARMTEQLRQVLIAFQAININMAVYFANVNEIFDEQNQAKNVEFWEKRVNSMLDEVLKFI